MATNPINPTTPLDLAIYFSSIGSGGAGSGWVPVEGLPTPADGRVGERAINVITGDIFPPKTRSGWNLTPEATLNLGQVGGTLGNILSRFPSLENNVSLLMQEFERLGNLVDGLENLVNSLNYVDFSGDITDLQINVGNIGGLIDGLDSRVDGIAIQLNGAFDDPERGINSMYNVLTGLYGYAGPGGTIAGQITTITGNYNNLYNDIHGSGKIKQQLDLAIDDLGAQAQSLLELETAFSDGSTGLQATANALQSLKAFAGPGSANAMALTQLGIRMDALDHATTGSVTQLAQTVGTLQNTVDGVTLGIESTIQDEVTARISPLVDSLGNSIGSVSATVSDLSDALALVTDSGGLLDSLENRLQNNLDDKTEVIYQSSTPATSYRRPNVLWIDTGQSNQPRRWNGSSWVLVSDTRVQQAASDAATARNWTNTTGEALQTYASSARTIQADANGVVTGIYVKSASGSNSSGVLQKSEIAFRTDKFVIYPSTGSSGNKKPFSYRGGSLKVSDVMVDTLSIGDQQVTVSVSTPVTPGICSPGDTMVVAGISIPKLPSGTGGLILMGFVNAIPSGGDGGMALRINRLPVTHLSYSAASMRNGWRSFGGVFARDTVSTTDRTYALTVENLGGGDLEIMDGAFVIMAGKR